MFTPDNPYFAQVALLVRVLPMVSRESCFALKGGTAINLFVQEMPRLSVDIDLAFLPVTDRDAALKECGAALGRIGAELAAASPPLSVRVAKREDGHAMRLLVAEPNAAIKIEVSPVLRGTVYPETTCRIVSQAEALFGFAEARTVSFEDLYAGKILAALDRQHPRDLFDVRLLLAGEGISPKLFRAFLVYLIGHGESMTRILQPRPKPLEDIYQKQFRNMSAMEVSLAELELARSSLIAALHQHIDDDARAFLLSFKRGEPKWDLLGIAHAPALPAVRWKLQNLARMESAKRIEAVEALEVLLDSIAARR